MEFPTSRGVVFFVAILVVATSPVAASPVAKVDHGSGSGLSSDPAPRSATVFEVEFALQQPLRVNQTSRLRISITARERVRNVTVTPIEPFGFGVRPTSETIGDLDANETATINLTVEPAHQLTRNLEIRLSGTQPNRSVRQRSAFELAVGSDAVSTQGTDSGTPAGNDTGFVGESGGGNDFRTHAQDTGTATSDCEEVSITGKGEYTTNGETKPMREVVVEVWDSDTESDNDFVASQNAAADGSFSFCVPERDSDADGAFDPFVAIVAQNPAAKTTDGSDNVYYASTASESNVVNGESIQFGSDVDGDGSAELVPSSSNPAWQAIDWALDERRVVRQATADDWTRSRVQIYWPVGTWPVAAYRYDIGTGEFSSQWMELPAKSTVDWDRTTVYHEYGHFVMYAAYGHNHYNLPPYGSYDLGHCAYSETDPGFAMLEGWAEFMTIVVTENPDDLSYLGQNIETNQWYDSDGEVNCVDGDTTGEMDGYRVEGSAASILFDILDTGYANDEAMDKDFDTLFSLVRTHHPKNITHLYELWSSDTRDALTPIYASYGVDEESPTVTITAPQDGAELDTSTLTVTGTANDTYSNVSSVAVKVGAGEWQTATYNAGEWTIDSRELEDGTYTITARATDAYNNSRKTTITATVTTVASNVSIRQVPGIIESGREKTTKQVGIAANTTLSLDNGSNYHFRLVNEDSGESVTLAINGSTDVQADTHVGLMIYEEDGSTKDPQLWPSGQGFFSADIVNGSLPSASGVTNFSVVLLDASSGDVISRTDTEPSVVNFTGLVEQNSTRGAVRLAIPRDVVPEDASVTLELSGGGLNGSKTYGMGYDATTDEFETVLNASTFEPGNYSWKTTFTWQGTEILQVRSARSANKNITFEAGEPTDTSVTDYTVSSTTVKLNETVTIDATVRNTGNASEGIDVTFYADGTAFTTKSVTVPGNGLTNVSATTSFATAGTHNVTVDGLAATNVTVESNGTTSSALDLSITTGTTAPNSTTTVEFTLTNQANDSLDGPAINITARPDWNITSRSDNAGTWKASTETWVWLSISAGSSKSPSLTMRVPNDTAIGDYTITAVGSDAHGHETTTNATISVTKGGAKSIERAIAGSDRMLSLGELQDAIQYWASGETVPDTGGKTIGLAKLQSLIQAWANGETV